MKKQLFIANEIADSPEDIANIHFINSTHVKWILEPSDVYYPMAYSLLFSSFFYWSWFFFELDMFANVVLFEFGRHFLLLNEQLIWERCCGMGKNLKRVRDFRRFSSLWISPISSNSFVLGSLSGISLPVPGRMIPVLSWFCSKLWDVQWVFSQHHTDAAICPL